MRKIKLPQQAHLMGEPSLVPPNFYEPLEEEIEEFESMEEELLKQWEWYEYENNMESS
jgi:hypothetical protein